MALRALSLFSGIGGLDLGVELATGCRVVCYVEREAAAAALLVERMQDGAITPAPVWSDVCTFDARRWRSCVDLVLGGFPCQDISVAGSGAGIEGDRSGLWSELYRAYRDTHARWLFLENVSALVNRGLDRVLGDLAALGCAAEWMSLRAADVGAPHRRERIFLLAERVSDAERDTVRQRAKRGPGAAPAADGRDAEPRDLGAESVANGDQYGQQKQRSSRCEPEMGDPDEPRLPKRRSHSIHAAEEHPAFVRAGLGDDHGCGQQRHHSEPFAWPPGPTDRHAWEQVPAWLQPAVEPGVRFMADGASLVVDAARAHRLRALGNGVVPLQAALAFTILARRMKEGA